MLPERLEEYDTLMTGQPIWRERLQGVGVITPSEALALELPGRFCARPVLSGIFAATTRTFDMTKLSSTSSSAVMATRLTGMQFVSTKFVNQCGSSTDPRSDARRRLPNSRQEGHPPLRARIDESMEALIHHFKIFTEGFKVPEGEVYVAIESPRGEIGCYIASDGSPTPYRMHVRAPSFVNIQCLPHMMRGSVADAVAVISSVDPVLGEVDR